MFTVSLRGESPVPKRDRINMVDGRVMLVDSPSRFMDAAK